jgi:hypothetical protein
MGNKLCPACSLSALFIYNEVGPLGALLLLWLEKAKGIKGALLQ